MGWGLGWAWAWAWGLYWLYLTDLVLCIAAEVTRHGLSSGCGRIDYQPGHARVSRGHDGGSFSDPNGLLEEYWAASRFWEYTEMEWDNGPFGKDIPETAVYIKGGEMERSAIPKPAFYIKRGEMERDLAVSTKRRESAESAKRRPLERLRRQSGTSRLRGSSSLTTMAHTSCWTR